MSTRHSDVSAATAAPAEASPASNPFTQFADSVPSGVARAVAAVAGLLGALLAFWIALDQSYDRTQIFATIVGVIALASIATYAFKVSRAVPLLGAGVLFFAGALLFHLVAGVAMLVAGAVAALFALIDARQSGTPAAAAISMFFTGAAVTSIAIAVILFTIEG